MGRENQPKIRQLAREKQKNARRPSYDRILIVTEGSKTEPQYFEEIRAAYRLHSANVEVQHSQLGTDPSQVVQYACKLFKSGDLNRGIRPLSFDKVFAVFDRDDHENYFNALNNADSLHLKMKNDNNQLVSFRAIASVPSFELWLLLHYEDIQCSLHRDEVLQRLIKYIPNYRKGANGVFKITRNQLAIATQRALNLSKKFNAHTNEPYTAIVNLVELLTTLKS
jgi:hypothetical protein